jgi:hypothetical protein
MAALAQRDFDMKRLGWMMLLLPFLTAACASGAKDAEKSVQPTLAAAEVPKVRAQILTMRDKTLEELFAMKPETRDELKKAVGYAVFDSSQINVVLFVGARGSGVLVDNATQALTSCWRRPPVPAQASATRISARS